MPCNVGSAGLHEFQELVGVEVVECADGLRTRIADQSSRTAAAWQGRGEVAIANPDAGTDDDADSVILETQLVGSDSSRTGLVRTRGAPYCSDHLFTLFGEARSQELPWTPEPAPGCRRINQKVGTDSVLALHCEPPPNQFRAWELAAWMPDFALATPSFNLDQGTGTGHWVAGCPGVRAPGPTPPESLSGSSDRDDSFPPYDASCSYEYGYLDDAGYADYGDYDGFDACDQEYGFGGDW